MRHQPSRRLTLWGGALALLLAPELALAQDGQPPTGPPVTAPRTNANRVNEARPITDSPPPETTDRLTPVPATASDPAPPGTRGVRVDVVPGGPGVPAAGPGVVPGAPGAGPQVAPGPRTSLPGIKTIEGVVTRISKPGKDLGEERIRFVVDPSQDWSSFVLRGPVGLPDRTPHSAASPRTTSKPSAHRSDDSARTDEAKAARNEDANHEADSHGREMILTRRSYVSTFARSPEGYNLFGVDHPSAPDLQTSRTGQTTRPVAAVPNAPQPASFANIREGSFVAVRYRKVGNVNDVLNVSLIELPSETATVPAAGVTTPRAVPGATAPTRGAPARTPAAGAGSAPVRVPVVPLTPTAPAIGRP